MPQLGFLTFYIPDIKICWHGTFVTSELKYLAFEFVLYDLFCVDVTNVNIFTNV